MGNCLMDDWQEAQLANRHVHNRVGKAGRQRGGGRSGGAFDVHRTFGTYEIKCSAAAKVFTDAGGTARGSLSKMEIFTLNQKGNALVGELTLVGVLHATVLLAGSRKTMSSVVRELENAGRSEVDEEAASTADVTPDEKRAALEDDDYQQGHEPDINDEDEDENEDEDEDEDDKHDQVSVENQRVREFEKNSFRSPKFWLKWQGQIDALTAANALDQIVTSTGYLVFSGNQCDRFQGTISCESLEWNNVKFSGFKTKSQPARDFAVTWYSS